MAGLSVKVLLVPSAKMMKLPSPGPQLIGSVVGVMVGVSVMVGVNVFVGVNVSVGVRVSVWVAVMVGVSVTVGVDVMVGVNVFVGVSVIVGVNVRVRVAVFVGVSVLVKVAVLVEVDVLVGVKVRVGFGVDVAGLGVDDGKKRIYVALGVTCAVSVPVTRSVLVTAGVCVAVRLAGFVSVGGFRVAVAWSDPPPLPLVGVREGVSAVTCQVAGVRMSGEIGSTTSCVPLSETYCAFGFSIESMLAFTVHCGTRPIASVPDSSINNNPSKKIAKSKVQSRLRCRRVEKLIVLSPDQGVGG